MDSPPSEKDTTFNTRKQALKKFFDDIRWSIDESKIKQEDYVEFSRLLMGILAIKYNIMIHLIDDVTNAFHQILTQYKENTNQQPQVHCEPLEENEVHEHPPHNPGKLDRIQSRVFLLSSGTVDSSLNNDSRSIREARRMSAVSLCEPSRLQKKNEALVLKDENNTIQAFIPSSEEVMLELSQITTISAIKFPNWFLNLYNCIQIANILISGIKVSSTDTLNFCIKFLEVPASAHGTYCSGNIRLKEAHTYIIESSFGPVQIGIPPETIKTSIQKGEPVPQYYVLPPNLFSGSSNFAFMNPDNLVVLIGEEAQLQTIKTIFKESIFGPDPNQIYYDDELSASAKTQGYSIDLIKERETMSARNSSGEIIPMDNFARFLPIENGIARWTHGSSQAEIHCNRGFIQFFENSRQVASIDINLSLHPHKCHYSAANVVEELTIPSTPFVPPTLGVTFLGTSHGFDAKGHTTGFIIWINGNGIMVDPPIHTTSYLRSHGIKPSFANKVILTHCHSDHDSGLLRKIMDGEKIELYTTKTIEASYRRKMNAVTGLNMADFYHFNPVPIGGPIRILGALFEFDYSFHTIPTIRFKLSYAGKSISYSSDTHYNPELYSKLREQKIITLEREMSLRMFLFDADLVIHEAGVPPIHTTIATLNELPTSVKKKIRIVHCHEIPAIVEKTLDDGRKLKVPVTNLRIPATGLSNTILLNVGEYMEGFSHAVRKLKFFTDTFLFRKLTPSLCHELFIHLEEVKFKSNEVIIQSEENSDMFYIIEQGEVQVLKDKEVLQTLTAGDVFGENALRRAKNIPRSATVIAQTECTMLTISSATFKGIMDKENEENFVLDYDIARMSRMRPFVKEVLSKTYLFQDLNPDQINFISAMLEKEMFVVKNNYILHEGDSDTSLYLIERGSVRLVRMDDRGSPRELMRLGVGQIFGELSLITGLPRTCSVIANEDCVLLELKKERFDRLMKQYQNLRVKLALLVEQRLRENVSIKAEMETKPGTSRINKQ